MKGVQALLVGANDDAVCQQSASPGSQAGQVNTVGFPAKPPGGFAELGPASDSLPMPSNAPQFTSDKSLTKPQSPICNMQILTWTYLTGLL